MSYLVWPCFPYWSINIYWQQSQRRWWCYRRLGYFCRSINIKFIHFQWFYTWSPGSGSGFGFSKPEPAEDQPKPGPAHHSQHMIEHRGYVLCETDRSVPLILTDRSLRFTTGNSMCTIASGCSSKSVFCEALHPQSHWLVLLQYCVKHSDCFHVPWMSRKTHTHN